MRTFKVNVNGIDYDVKIEEIGGGFVPNCYAPSPVATPAPVAATTPAAAPTPAVAPTTTTAETSSSTVTQAPKATAPAGSTKINSPFPGSVLKVNVKPGDTVKKGDVLCVIEAMKMENDITSPCDGTVASVNISLGINVATDDLLVSLN